MLLYSTTYLNPNYNLDFELLGVESWMWGKSQESISYSEFSEHLRKSCIFKNFFEIWI